MGKYHSTIHVPTIPSSGGEGGEDVIALCAIHNGSWWFADYSMHTANGIDTTFYSFEYVVDYILKI